MLKQAPIARVVGTECKHCGALLLRTPCGAVCSDGCPNARIQPHVDPRAIDKAWFWKWAIEKTVQIIPTKEGFATIDGRKITRGRVIKSRNDRISVGWMHSDDGMRVYEIEFIK